MGRRDLTPRMSWDDSCAVIAYVTDACALAGADGDSAVGALAKPLEKVLGRWEDLDVERRERRRAVGRAHALVRRRDLQADAVVTTLHNDALAQVKLDRSSPLFQRLFPDPLSSVVRMALESQLPVMRTLAHALGEEETPAPLKKAHTKPLMEAIERGQSAVHAREQAFSSAGQTSARIASWREDANHVLRGVEGTLQKLAAERRLGPDWVDAYFPASDRTKKAKRAEPTNNAATGDSPK